MQKLCYICNSIIAHISPFSFYFYLLFSYVLKKLIVVLKNRTQKTFDVLNLVLEKLFGEYMYIIYIKIIFKIFQKSRSILRVIIFHFEIDSNKLVCIFQQAE